jgi:uncharacterized protein
MKASAYTVPVELADAGVLLLYNTRTGALLEFPLTQRADVDAALAAPREGDALAGELTRLGFLVDDDTDELALLEAAYRAARDDRTRLALTIAPTVNCNFRCTYCYQEHPETKMAAAVQDALVERVRAGVAEGRDVQVTWFGGEPLLALDVVELLSRRFIALADAAGVRYAAGMITNGSLLTRDVAERLRVLRIDGVQVTLDGPADVHDGRRFKVGGKPTFETIVENLQVIADLLDVALRINCDQENRDRVLELLDELEARGLRGRVRPYVAAVGDYTEVCADVAGTCMSSAEFSAFEAETMLAMHRRGWGVPRRPEPIDSVCIADKASGAVVDPTGRVYKCWNDLTRPREAVGHLQLIPTIEMKKKAETWERWSPFRLPECRACVMLPVCMGGCAFEAMKVPNPTHGDCTHWKHSLPEVLALQYLEIERARFDEALAAALESHQWTR